MTYAGVSVGKTKAGKYKAYCLISRDGTTSPEGNNLRAIAFQDQPVRGFPDVRSLLGFVSSISPDKLTDYIGDGEAASKGVHLGTQEAADTYVYSILEWNGTPPRGPGEPTVGWQQPRGPQLLFGFMYD